MLVDLAKASPPVLVLAAADADPGQNARDREVGFVRLGADEIDDLVAHIVGKRSLRSRRYRTLP